MNNPKLVKIGDLARACKLPVSTVRYYNSLGIIEEAYRTPGRVRLFNRDRMLGKIRKARAINSNRTLEQVKALV